jgi:hypothetical protein
MLKGKHSCGRRSGEPLVRRSLPSDVPDQRLPSIVVVAAFDESMSYGNCGIIQRPVPTNTKLAWFERKISYAGYSNQVPSMCE